MTPLGAIVNFPPQLTGWRIAAVVVCAGALAAADALIHLNRVWPVASAVLVIAAIGVAWLLRHRPANEEQPTLERAPGTLRAGLGVALCVIGMVAAGYASQSLAQKWEEAFDGTAPLAVAGIALWSLGLGLWDWRREPFTFGRDAMPRWERLALLGIVALSLGFRFYRFDYFPPPGGICAIEEPQTGQWGWLILNGERPWEFLLDRWLAATAIWLGGANLIALRTPFTIFSALTVVPLYFLLRCLVSRGVALVTALLFVVCHWHLIYARYAHNIYFTTILVVLVLYLLVRSRLDSRIAFYPWIGFIAGYTLYAYAGYRGTTIVVALFMGGVLLADIVRLRQAVTPARRQLAGQWLRRQVLASLFAAAAWLVAVWPLYSLISRAPGGLTYYVEAANRSLADPDYYAASTWETARQWLVRVRDTAMIFHHIGEDWVTMNLPKLPMLDPAVGALFTVGFVYGFLAWRTRYQGYFALIFLLLLLGGAVFVHNLDVRRLQQVIPLIFVLCAFVLERLRELLLPLGRRGRIAFAALATAIVLVAYARNIHAYFGKMIHAQTVRVGFHNQYTLAINYLHSLPDNAYLYLLAEIDNFFQFSDYEWLRGTRVPGVATSDLYPLLTGARGPWAGRDLRLLMKDPSASRDLTSFLVEQLRGSACEPLPPPDRTPERFTACRIVQEAPPVWLAGGGIRARYYHGHEPQPFLERIEPFVDYSLIPDACRFTPHGEPPVCRAAWDATWAVTEELRATLETDARRAHAAVWIDGNRIDKWFRLVPGSHAVRIIAQMESIEEPGVRVRWLTPDDKRPVLLPFYRLAQPATGDAPQPEIEAAAPAVDSGDPPRD
jgi:hypothetical protein